MKEWSGIVAMVEQYDRAFVGYNFCVDQLAKLSTVVELKVKNGRKRE